MHPSRLWHTPEPWSASHHPLPGALLGLVSRMGRGWLLSQGNIPAQVDAVSGGATTVPLSQLSFLPLPLQSWQQGPAA